MADVSIGFGNGRAGLTTLCLSLALLLGLFFPTSIHAEISRGLGYVSALTLFAIYVGLAVAADCLSRPPLFVCSVTINATLLLATLISPLSGFAPGAFTFYFLLSSLYLLDLRAVEFGRFLRGLFTFTSIVLLILAGASILPSERLIQFFINNYAAFYPELLPNMFRLGKPVLMFASHSLAGFFYCLFFLLNFLRYTQCKRVFHLLLALCFLVVSLTLQSVTAYVYVLVGVLHILFHFGIHRITAVRLCTLAAAAVIAGVLVFGEGARALLWTAISPLFTSQTNGLAARYASTGSLAPNIEYILTHPLTPVGVRYSEDLWFVDSGPVEHMLRGSLPLVVAVYFGLFKFLRENLRSWAHCLMLLGVYLAFESGFSNLTYLRTLYLTPFVVAFLNGVSRDVGARGGGSGRAWVPAQECAGA